MEVFSWIPGHWFELAQTLGIVGSLLLAVHTNHEDEKARKIANSIAVNHEYRQIWKELFSHPELSRVLAQDLDFEKEPISEQEELFVIMLMQHLGTAYRARKHDEFVKLEGLRRDVREFFRLPIPKSVWEKMKIFQDEDFVRFVEDCLERD